MRKDRGNARRRMQEAAVELFLHRGFDGTTAAAIAGRAGVTERTFFRHFPDKRDVLFDEAALRDGLEAAIVDAPSKLDPMGVILWAFRLLAPMFEANRPISEPAQTVIARTPALQERQLSKTSALVATMASALRRRGFEPRLADLGSAVGMAVAANALQEWFRDPALPLVDRFENAFRTLEELSNSPREAIKRHRDSPADERRKTRLPPSAAGD